MQNNMFWKGKPLEDYSKEELVKIIVQMNNRWLRDMHEHNRQLEFLVGLRNLRRDDAGLQDKS